MENDLMCRRERLERCDDDRNPILKKTRAKIQFEDLPEDVLTTILSELTLKDAVRTSAVSSKLKRLWTLCPKLRFDAVTMCGREGGGDNAGERRQYVQRFIDNVDTVLKQHRGCKVVEDLVFRFEFGEFTDIADAVLEQHRGGKVVEDLEARFEFDRMLFDHLDDWVSFVVLSQTKNLDFDLAPAETWCLYRFPFELLDSGSMSRLQHLQLRYMSLKPPSQFSGFPNLRELDLCLIYAIRDDLQNMLSNCVNLEWLQLDRCYLDDELKVARPLPKLLHLTVVECHVTKIELNSRKLKTFAYEGKSCPIDLGQAPYLKGADIYFSDDVTLEDVLTTAKPGLALANQLPSVQNMTLEVQLMFKTPWPLQNPCKFSQLKYLQLYVLPKFEDEGNMLSLASLLRAAPFVEMLEIHFHVYTPLHLDSVPTMSLPRFPHRYLKNLHVTGFIGCTSQLEFLLYTLENAPALEVFTVDPSNKFLIAFDRIGEAKLLAHARERARGYFDGRTSPHTKLCIL